MIEQFTFFYNGFLSQWHPSPFEIDEIQFINAEQYMMYRKALLFKDEDIAYKIMKSTNESLMDNGSFWFPEQASTYAHSVDSAYNLILILSHL